MGTKQTGVISLACEASAKGGLPEGLCSTFADRLAAAYPGQKIAYAGAGEAPVVRLVLGHASSRRLEANMVWQGRGGEVAGPPMGTALADGDLGKDDLVRFFDNLIKASPAP